MEYYKPFRKDLSNFSYAEITKQEDQHLVSGKPVENNRAINGDIVYYDENTMEVVGIKQRFQGLIVGILHLNNNQKYGFTKKKVPYIKFTSLSGKFPNFIVPSKVRQKTAHYCVIKFNKWDTSNKHPIGQIEYLLGSVGNRQFETEALLFKTNVYPRKSKFKYNELPSLEESFNDYKTFSIDPVGCKDIDDALHYKELGNGKKEIGIHIANVARYVDSWDTNFFSSVYLKEKQINMLDESHSFEKCSLGHGEKKRALSLILTFDGFVLEKYEFMESIVRNNALSYQDVEKMISDCSGGGIYKLWDFTSKLKLLPELSATKMVEYYMLLYNKLVAETLYKYDKRTILRTHSVQDTHLTVEDSKLADYLHKISQSAAVYESNPVEKGHQDLEMKFYTHATSPIRRYVDIINQKNIINFLEGRDIILEEKLEEINDFQKKLRRFYNHYKKLDIIFGMEEARDLEAFIVGIEGIKLRVYIPELDIEHGFLGISRKLLECNKIIENQDYLEINDVKLGIMDKITVRITALKYEERFNKKLNIKILNPEINLL